MYNMVKMDSINIKATTKITVKRVNSSLTKKIKWNLKKCLIQRKTEHEEMGNKDRWNK